MADMTAFIETFLSKIKDDTISPMEQILEQMLDEAAAKLARLNEADPSRTHSNEPPAVMIQPVIFKDGSGGGGAVKRGPLPRTYVLGQQATQQGRDGTPVPVKGVIVELTFHGSDIQRLGVAKEVAKPLLASLDSLGPGFDPSKLR